MGKTWGSVQVSSAVRGVTSLVSKFRGAFNPGRGRREEMMGMRPARLLCTSPYPLHIPPCCTCGEGDAGWGGEVGTPEATHSGSVVGVEYQVTQGVVHSTARGGVLQRRGWEWG